MPSCGAKGPIRPDLVGVGDLACAGDVVGCRFIDASENGCAVVVCSHTGAVHAGCAGKPLLPLPLSRSFRLR